MQCAKNHAAWYTDSSCSISVSNDFATQKKYHLALFTFKGVSSTKSTACLFFEEIICTAAMLPRSAMTAFTCSSDCNLKTLSVTRTMSEPSSSAVTLPMTRCTLPSHMLKRIACCNWQKALHPEMLGKLRLHCHHLLILQHDDPVIPRARLNDLGFPIFCPHQHSDIAGKNCRGSQLDTEAREQQVLMRASNRKHHSCRPLILHSNNLLDHRTLCLRIPLAQRLLHTDTFTHRPFYTQTLLHTEAFKHSQTHRPPPPNPPPKRP